MQKYHDQGQAHILLIILFIHFSRDAKSCRKNQGEGYTIIRKGILSIGIQTVWI